MTIPDMECGCLYHAWKILHIYDACLYLQIVMHGILNNSLKKLITQVYDKAKVVSMCSTV